MENVSPLKAELDYMIAHRTKCGLCAYYPINAGMNYYCPVVDADTTRLSAPPKLTGGRTTRFLCFQPLHVLAYTQYKTIRLERRGGERQRTY